MTQTIAPGSKVWHVPMPPDPAHDDSPCAPSPEPMTVVAVDGDGHVLAHAAGFGNRSRWLDESTVHATEREAWEAVARNLDERSAHHKRMTQEFGEQADAAREAAAMCEPA